MKTKQPQQDEADRIAEKWHPAGPQPDWRRLIDERNATAARLRVALRKAFRDGLTALCGNDPKYMKLCRKYGVKP